MEIKVSRNFLSILTILATITLIFSLIFKFPIFAILAFFTLINNFLNFFRKIKISQRQAVYYAIFVQRNIRYVESIHCTGFWIFNCVRVGGTGISAIKLYCVQNFQEIKEYSENL